MLASKKLQTVLLCITVHSVLVSARHLHLHISNVSIGKLDRRELQNGNNQHQDKRKTEAPALDESSSATNANKNTNMGSFKIDDGDVIGGGIYEIKPEGVTMDIKIKINPGARSLCPAPCPTDTSKQQGGAGPAITTTAAPIVVTTPPPSSPPSEAGPTTSKQAGTTPVPDAGTPKTKEQGQTTPSPVGSGSGEASGAANAAGDDAVHGHYTDRISKNLRGVSKRLPELNKLKDALSEAAATWAFNLRNGKRREFLPRPRVYYTHQNYVPNINRSRD